MQLDLMACSERKLWQGSINKAIWAQRWAKHLFLLHEEKLVSVTEANRASERGGSGMLSPKPF